MQSRDTVIHSHTNQSSKSKILPEIQDLIDDDALTDFLALEKDDFECERNSSRPTTTLNIRRQTITLTLETLILVSAFQRFRKFLRKEDYGQQYVTFTTSGLFRVVICRELKQLIITSVCLQGNQSLLSFLELRYFAWRTFMN